jgi:2-C-methyl-D-erythritol 4-phosphate cytidylyltransferase
MGADKMLTDLEGLPLLARVVQVFQSSKHIAEIVLVMNSTNIQAAKEITVYHDWNKVSGIYLGGALRQDSVAAGLAHLRAWPWVVIQDGARPLVTEDMIERGLVAARVTGAAVAAVPTKDTIKQVSQELTVECTLERSRLWSIQTPQVFSGDLIRQAYKYAEGEVTDDATLLERQGKQVTVYYGADDNIKVTTPTDLELARILWRSRGKKCG